MKHIGDLTITNENKDKYKDLVEVSGYLYVRAEFKAPLFNKEVKTSKLVADEIRFNAKKANRDSFERQGYLFADEILQRIISKKTVGNLTIYKTKHIALDKTQFVVFDGVNYSHGETLEQAKNDLMFKISSRDTTEFKSWKVTDVKPIEDLIKAYRSITGACSTGTKDFCNSQTLKDKYQIKEVIEMTKGKFGHDIDYSYLKGVPKTITKKVIESRKQNQETARNKNVGILIYNCMGKLINEFRCPQDIEEYSIKNPNAFPILPSNKGRNNIPIYVLKHQNIINCCRGDSKHYKGLIFRYKNSELPVKPLTLSDFKRNKKVTVEIYCRLKEQSLSENSGKKLEP